MDTHHVQECWNTKLIGVVMVGPRHVSMKQLGILPAAALDAIPAPVYSYVTITTVITWAAFRPKHLWGCATFYIIICMSKPSKPLQ